MTDLDELLADLKLKLDEMEPHRFLADLDDDEPVDRESVRLRSLLSRAYSAVDEYAKAKRPADVGEDATPDEVDEFYDGPVSDPSGPFLLIGSDPYSNGHLWMRRYRTKEDAAVPFVTYLGAQMWLFEVVREIPRDAAMIDSMLG